MLRDTDAACVATALALCLKKEKNRRWNTQWYKRRLQYTQENLMTDLILSEPSDFFFLWRFDGPSFYGILKTVSPTIAK